MRLLRRVGWTSLFAWACAGLALETAHGLKLASYLDDPMTRELLTLAHAHGVGLALVSILVAEHGLSRVPEARRRGVALAVAFASVTIPLGFALSSFGHTEGDPGVAIWIVPPAALALLFALGAVALGAWREPEDSV
jgi:hypothetical protein